MSTYDNPGTYIKKSHYTMAHITIHLVVLAAILQKSHVSLAGKKTLSLILCTGFL